MRLFGSKYKGKDWCTWWPEGSWGHCCRRHDKAYDTGVPFHEANRRLCKCVRRKAGRGMAYMMLIGTTLFGVIPYWKSRMALKKLNL